MDVCGNGIAQPTFNLILPVSFLDGFQCREVKLKWHNSWAVTQSPNPAWALLMGSVGTTSLHPSVTDIQGCECKISVSRILSSPSHKAQNNANVSPGSFTENNLLLYKWNYCSRNGCTLYVPSDKDSKDKVNINDYNFDYFFSFWCTVSLLGLTAHKLKPTFWMII